MNEALTAIESWPLAEELRRSLYLYPLVNALHIFGLALLIGSILPFDLRILGLFRDVPLQPLAGFLPGVAAAGLSIAVIAGALLFIVRPLDYAENPAFLIKIALVGLGTMNAVVQQLSPGFRAIIAGGRPSAAIRMRAGLSLAVWPAALLAGRAIGYIE